MNSRYPDTLLTSTKTVFSCMFARRPSSPGAAQVVWVEGEKVPLMVQKTDGGFGYGTTDMAALRQRVQDERGEWLIYVVDEGQAGHFRHAPTLPSLRKPGSLQKPWLVSAVDEGWAGHSRRAPPCHHSDSRQGFELQYGSFSWAWTCHVMSCEHEAGIPAFTSGGRLLEGDEQCCCCTLVCPESERDGGSQAGVRSGPQGRHPAAGEGRNSARRLRGLWPRAGLRRQTHPHARRGRGARSQTQYLTYMENSCLSFAELCDGFWQHARLHTQPRATNSCTCCQGAACSGFCIL